MAAAVGQARLLVANKADNDRRELEVWEFLSLGLGEPYPVSALHGRRTGDLLDDVVALLPDGTPSTSTATGEPHERAPSPAVPGVAIVGRPNVGKSTLFNRLIGDERSVVHDLPGTTRDAIDTVVETPDGPIRFVDTAGMRRKSRIDDGTEYYSLVRALQAVDDADVALLVIDATEGVTSQDQRLAERVDAAGCPVVVLLNKWDLLADAERRAASPPSSPAACTSSATRRCSRCRRSRARACTDCCPCWPTPSSATTAGCPPARSTR